MDSRGNYVISFLFLWIAISVKAQLNIAYTINTSSQRASISPYIYGVNIPPAWNSVRPENIGARRLGGNRMSGYNWENNFSNAGSDYGPNRNDNYLFLEQGASTWNTNPGEVIKMFHDTSLAIGAYSLMTVPMAGYVSTYQFANVTTTAPSSDWYQIIPAKGSAFSLTPNTSDNVVYADEMVNWIVDRYGKASTSTGIKGYSLDNEPDFWYSTHPLIHGSKVGCQELIDKSIATATAVKNVDPDCDIFGYVSYGYYGYVALQGASDWNSGSFLQSVYPWYIDAYLDKMKSASTSAGKRLVDVLDLHWYTEHQGLDASGTKRRVYGDGASWEYDQGVCESRMQAPRSFWDPNFVEDSWITNNGAGSAIQLIPVLKNKINNWWPGTKLSFSEWSFSGTNHVSGGIATADMFGIFGKYGVYFSSFWGDVSNYISAGFELYRNYDGNKSTFEDTSVEAAPANTSDYQNTSVYASINNASDSELHIIVLNKHWTDAINATFNITSSTTYKNATVYMFDDTSSDIKLVETISNIINNSFTYTLPKLSAAHIVLDNGILPVDLLNFEGSIENNKASLFWTVMNETDIKGYEILKSDESQLTEWDSLTFISASNISSQTLTYTYNDSQLLQNSTTYYKLNLIDTNGNIMDSIIIEVGNNEEVQIFPNPSSTGFNIDINSDKEAEISIVDLTGRIVEIKSLQKGKNNFVGESLKSGVYFAKISTSEFTKVIKLIKD